MASYIWQLIMIFVSTENIPDFDFFVYPSFLQNMNMYGLNNGSVPFNNGQCATANTFQAPYNPATATMQQQQQQPQFATQQQPQQQQQGMWPQQQQPGYYYNGASNSGVGPFNGLGTSAQYGPNGSAAVSTSMQQQQQQQQQWNPQTWNSWQQQQTPMPQQQQNGMAQQQQQQTAMPQQPPNMNGAVAGAVGGAAAVAAIAAPGAKRCDSYQRTFDYVQQCQNWTAQQ
jgi:hypothetical protein